jgi:hypothetical protein
MHESRPLLKYVLSDGFGHLSHLEPHNSGILKDIEALRQVIHRYALEWDRLCKLVPSIRTGIPWPTSDHDFTVYTLIAFGSEALLETFVHQTSLAPQQGTNPLVYAAHFGKVNHAMTLISQGVDLNQPGLTIADSDSSDAEMPHDGDPTGSCRLSLSNEDDRYTLGGGKHHTGDVARTRS